jgi:hypothetical protein
MEQAHFSTRSLSRPNIVQAAFPVTSPLYPIPLSQNRILGQNSPQFLKGDVLDLADSFLAQSDQVSDLLKSAPRLSIHGKTVRQNGGLEIRQFTEISIQRPPKPLETEFHAEVAQF